MAKGVKKGAPKAARETPKPRSSGGMSKSDGTSVKLKPAVTEPQCVNQGTLTFWDLPPNARTRIYRYAGLLRPCTIDMSNEQERLSLKHDRNSECLNRGSPLDPREKTGIWKASHNVKDYCDHPRLPTNLFEVSRAVRDEIGPYFFSHNRFEIRLCSYRQDLEYFTKSTNDFAHHLRYLHVDFRYKDNRYIRTGARSHEMKFSLWTDFCEMAQASLPNLRAFSLRTKVKDLDLTLKLASAMPSFPLLYDCAFQFDTSRAVGIIPVLEQTAHRLTSPARHRAGTFRFFDLPKEMQFMVHEYLLAHRWDPYMVSTVPEKGIIVLVDRNRFKPGCQRDLTCCGTCSIMDSACFCRHRQTAYSTSCTCFSSPLPYFLVCHEFYEDARAVLFSKNNFATVTGDPNTVMRLINPIPTSSFMQIRHLTIRLPVVTVTSFRAPGRLSDQDSLVAWGVLRRFIREHFKLSSLSLTLIALGDSIRPRDLRASWVRRLAESFADLQGLKDFRAYLVDHPSLEAEVERAVMGDRYRPKRHQRVIPLFDVYPDKHYC